MTIIAKHQDLAVHEFDMGYEIEHIPTGLRHWMGDGVDMLFGNGELTGPFPGTDSFNTCMLDFIKGGDILEAYFPQLLEPRVHYIAMAGIVGCLPNYCDVFWSSNDAFESLVQLHELSKRGSYYADLKRRNYVHLLLSKHGNEYAEIIECSCLTPWIHNEEGRLEWE